MQKTINLITASLLLMAGCAGPAFPSLTMEPATASPDDDPYLDCLSGPVQMNEPRAAHTATLLPDGRVLIAGGFRSEGTREIAIASAEIYDPATGEFTPTENMNEPRNSHIAVLLPDGLVLLAGGWNETRRTASAELFDPQTGTFRLTGSLSSPRDGMTGTLLEDGRVLVAGGGSAMDALLPAAEIYDPTTEQFSLTGNLSQARRTHTATLLKDGTVLLAGGHAGESLLASAEIYDPRSGEFAPVGALQMARHKHSAALLENGQVLIIGGSDLNDWTGQYKSAEIFDPRTGTSTLTGHLNAIRFKMRDAVEALPDGNVLVAGGNRMIEIFDVQIGQFIPGGMLDAAYYYSVTTRLPDGSVLITGGYDSNIRASDQAWIFCPVDRK